MIKSYSSFKEQQLLKENWQSYIAGEHLSPWQTLVKECYEEILAEENLHGELLEEGAWSKIKYYMGKLGSLEKGGKMFGRSKRTAAAAEKLQQAIDRAAAKGFGDFRKNLENQYNELPNMEQQEEFVSALMDIGAIYDSLDSAVQQFISSNGESGLDPDSANAVVESLREYVKFLLDYKLADAYKHFTENKDEIEEVVGGVAPTGTPSRRTPASMQGRQSQAGYAAPEGPAGKYTRAGRQGDDVDSATIKGLQSNLLPILLGLGGAAGVVAGMLMKTPWALNLVKGAKTPAQVVKGLKTITTTMAPKSGEGFTQMFGRLAGGNPATFDPSSNPQDLFDAMTKMGVDPQNPTQLYQLGVDQAAYQQAIGSGAGTVGEMFPASNTDLWLDQGASATSQMTQQASAKIIPGSSAGAGAVAAGKLAAASALAKTLGIGLLASGAAVKLIRMKGLKSSRAAMLRDLYRELVPFEGAQLTQTPPKPPPPVECPDGQVPDPEDPTKCIPEPEKLPPKVQVKKPGIAVLDDDTVSIFRIRWRKKDKVDAQRDIYQAAQQAAIIGRNTDPTSDQVAEPSKELRPFRADQKTFAQIKKRAAGRSGEEPYFAIDGSIIADLGNKSGKSRGAGIKRAGIGKERASKLVRFLFKDMLRRERKVSQKMADYAMRRLKIDDPQQQELVRNQLRAYGILEQALKENKQQPDEAWNKLRSRWKDLSGVK